jgi:phage-related minor tail protein
MSDTSASLDETSQIADSVTLQVRDLELSANSFSRAMTSAFAVSVTGGRQFDDVLKSLALRLSSLSLGLALKPVQNSIAGGIENLLSGLTGTGASASTAVAAASGAVKPFASGGVIGTPTYFPLMQGGVGLAGEAGPEAIMPLRRGPDGRLGVAGAGGGVNNVTIQIATPDPGSFRRSESYITGQIARAVARGQRSL